MNYITAIFERADIQHIREFLLNGVECYQIDKAPYAQRLENGTNKALGMVREHFPECYEELENKMFYATTAYERVYMEIGMQVGMKLAIQIFNFRV